MDLVERSSIKGRTLVCVCLDSKPSKQATYIKNYIYTLQQNCSICNYSLKNCVCSLCSAYNKVIYAITQKRVKKRKYISIIWAKFQKKMLKIIKDALGTGGHLFEDRLQIRGRRDQRLNQVLKDLGYSFKD